MAHAPVSRHPHPNGWVRMAQRLGVLVRTEAFAWVSLGIVLVIIVHLCWAAIISAMLETFTILLFAYIIGRIFFRGGSNRRSH